MKQISRLILGIPSWPSEALGQERNFQRLMREATQTGWTAYSKRPFAGPEQVLAYLSRYTHRVGISNRRLLQLDRAAGTVTFNLRGRGAA